MTVPGDLNSTLSGQIDGSLRFSRDTSGYGVPGVVELGFSSIKLQGTGIDLIEASDPSPCGTDPVLLETHGPIRIGSSLPFSSQGHIDLFQQKFSIDLHTAFSFAADTRPDCTLVGGTPPPYTTTSVIASSSNPPLPLRLDGSFRVSPALTADGYVRFGKLQISGPQADSFVQIHTCTQAPPPATGCATNTEGVVTGRLVATAFSADVLVGKVPVYNIPAGP